MNRKQLLLVTCLSLARVTYAESSNQNQISSAPESARFEMIQSDIAAKGTYRIDKYSGVVHQLVTGEKGLSWQELPAEKQDNDTMVPGKVNYQIFTSGIAMRMTYLMNVNTGVTWQLVESDEIGLYWSALAK